MSESASEIDEIEQAWDIGRSAIIPLKSKNRYERTYQDFKKWCIKKTVNITEKVLVAYFVERSSKLKAPGSLWAEYSMLKSTIFLNDSINISTFSTLIAYLKRKNVGYRPKKSNIFTRDNMIKFFNKAPDEMYLIHKVAMLLGIAGACRREELYNMKIEDIEDRGELLVVNIPNSKTDIQRTFVVKNDDENILYLNIYRKYVGLGPTIACPSHLFLNYRNGKCTKQVVGKGTIGSWPSKIAKYLELPDASNYTGHSLRRTSATLLANKGVDVLGLKRHGGWKSSTVAEGYVEDSLENKLEFAGKILQEKNENSHQNSSLPNMSSNSTFSIASSNNDGKLLSFGNNSTNCTFNVYLNK